MAEIVVFHHAQGLTDGMIAFADELRDAGHTVHTPDLYDGRTFDTLDDGVAHAGEIGFETCDGTRSAGGGWPAAGTGVCRVLARGDARPEAGADPGRRSWRDPLPRLPAVHGIGASWPEGVPVQVHAMVADPFFVDEGDLDAARALVAETKEAELFLYPGDRHLFADESLDSYDAAAAAHLRERVKAFLDEVEARQ